MPLRKHKYSILSMTDSKKKTILGYVIFFCHIGEVFLGAPLPKYDSQKCETLSLENCLKDLLVFQSLTDLPFTSDSNELDKLCNKCASGYNCSTTLAENIDCLSAENKKKLPMYVSMAQFMYLFLCGNEESMESAYLRTDFLEQSECILKHKNELKCCAKETSIVDLPVLNLLDVSQESLPEKTISTCCSLSLYMQCASNVTIQCGEKAANLTQNYIRRAAGEQVQGACQEVPSYPEPDFEICPRPELVCSGSFNFHLQQTFYGLAISILILIMSQRIL